MVKLSFFGGTRMVAGSNYLIETENTKILVDCGLFQGEKVIEDKNYEKFPYNPKSIDFLLVTHAHMDHIGRIPKLYKEGFRGKILGTRPTKDLTHNMLLDSQGIMKDEAKRENRKPPYSQRDVIGVMELFEGIDYHQILKLSKGTKCQFRDAGHILGSSIIELWIGQVKIVFSGDLGNPPVPLLKPTEFIDETDYVLVESAYGDRLHEKRGERKDLLENAIEDTITRKGVLMIPAFALERTQELLYELNSLVENHRISSIPIFVDSPLAIRNLDIYKKYPEYYNKESVYLIESGDELFKFKGLKFTETVKESKKINDVPPPKIIIAGSGMSEGGRILHHEIRYLPDPNSILLIIGYQVSGTLGRKILDGAQKVKIFRENIPVRAEVKAIGGYSAHADQKGLYQWIAHIKRPVYPLRNGKKDIKGLKKVFVVQGEEGPALALVQKIKDNLGVETEAPYFREEIVL